VIPSDPAISDHHATAAHFKVSSVISKPMQRHVWLYKQADFEQLNELINNANWDFITNTNVDESTKLFTTQFIELAKRCIPYILVTIRPNDKPWYDSLIRTFTRKRNRLRSIAIKNPTPTNWS
jgi:hypothetical protein